MLRTSLSFFLATTLLRAQFFPLEISEVLVQPTAGGHQMVELSTSNQPIDVTGHLLMVGATALALPPVTIPEYTSAVLHLGVNGVSTPLAIFLPTAPPLTSSGSLTLFSAASPSVNDLLSYVDWGGALGPNIALAVQARQWTTTTVSAVLPTAQGATLANRRYSRNAATLVGPDAWYADTTPTLGSENDPGWSFWYALGCPGQPSAGLGFHPSHHLDTGPWLGETTTLIVSPVSTVAVLVVSHAATPPVPLDSIGMPGCFANLPLDATLLLLPTTGNQAHFSYTVPINPLLVGVHVNMQALVPDPAAPNPLQAWVTEAIRGIVGSR
jgi:hypothetical protein